jgi:hypothetical protein
MDQVSDTASTLKTGRAAHEGPAGWARPDTRRTLQLLLAAIWLLDGVLQLQPFMFTAGSNGFSGMLNRLAPGNPHIVAQTITWNASIINHHAAATNAAFAFIQILLGLGIAWRPSTRLALGASAVWSLGVWWFGEGLGGVLHGAGTPVGGGPGAVLFYGLLAVLLWPSTRTQPLPPFDAGRVVGVRFARWIWAAVWIGLALLALIGSGRAPQGIHDVIVGVDTGQPGWLAAIDRHAASIVSGHGLTVAVALAAVCVVVALGVFQRGTALKATLVLAAVTAAVIWVVGENFGGILAGGATDPNSGPLLILLALTYWPSRCVAVDSDDAPVRDRPVEIARATVV